MTTRKRVINKLFLLSILGIIISFQIFPQQIPFGRLTVNEGLSNNSVYCLLQDKTGFLWIGTDDGLNRYDGYELKIYRNDPDDKTSLPENVIWSLYEDKNGLLWIGTKSGKLSTYDSHLDKFTNWDLEPKKNSANSITCISQDHAGDIWIGTYKNGLYKFDRFTKKIKHFKFEENNPNSLSSDYVTSIVEDDLNNLWISTYKGLNKSVIVDNSISFKHIYQNHGQDNGLINNLVWFLKKSNLYPGSILIGTLNGLERFEPSSNKFYSIILPENKELPYSQSVSSVTEQIIDNDKIFWVSTYGGLVRVNLSNNELNRFIFEEEDEASLLNNQVNYVINDQSGVIWIATDNGLNYFSPKKTQFNSFFNQRDYTFTKQKFYHKNLRAITQTADETLWLGTDAGLFGIKNISSTPKNYSNDRIEKLNTWSLFQKNPSELWIGTYGEGLKLFDINNKLVKSIQIKNEGFNPSAYKFVKCLLQDNSGVLWIGFWGGGLARLDPKTQKIKFWRNEDNDSTSLSYNDVWTIFQDSNNRMWIGTNGGGLDLLDKNSEEVFYHWNNNKDKNNYISNNSIYSICEATRNIEKLKKENTIVLWVGTGNGLNKLIINYKNGLSKPDVIIKSYTTKDGLADNSIVSIIEEDDGNLWLSTNLGISFFDVQKNTFTNYNVSDGVHGNSFNSSSALKSKNGLMYFGSTSGLNIFNPDKIIKSKYSPSVVITNFEIFNKSVHPGVNSPLIENIVYSKTVNLSYSQNVFSFQFSALDYNSPRSIQYAYKMDGFDNDWIITPHNFVTYTNLDAGRYTFKLKASNSDGIWSDKVTELLVIIAPPFWGTWWFRVIVLLGLFGLVSFLYKRRISNLQKEKSAQEDFSKQLIHSQEEERKRIASELHDSLGQNLLIIKNRAVLGLKSGEQDFEKKQLNEISGNASSAIDEVRRIAYNLHPYQLERLGLTKAISSIIDNLESSTGIIFKFEIDDINHILKPEEEINLYRIIQECISNIVKHSGSKSAYVSIKKENDIIIKIEDSGIGLTEGNFNINSVEKKGFGFKNLQERIKLLKGELIIDSAENKGTKLFIKIPVNNER
jgi:signal transduction histidine kinase/ligand-binding sensor domain-containing protein